MHCHSLSTEMILYNVIILQAAITHSNGADKDSVYFDWTAPANGTGIIRFRCVAWWLLLRLTFGQFRAAMNNNFN